MNLLKKIEAKQVEKLKAAGQSIPEFGAGDTLRVNVRMKEGDRERVQAYEGICIARKNAGLNSSFTVRKISFGEGVERVFPLYSPRLESIVLVRRGEVRRAKLYYLKDRRGKSARIAERDMTEADVQANQEQAASIKVARAERAEAAKAAAPAKGGKKAKG